VSHITTIPEHPDENTDTILVPLSARTVDTHYKQRATPISQEDCDADDHICAIGDVESSALLEHSLPVEPRKKKVRNLIGRHDETSKV